MDFEFSGCLKKIPALVYSKLDDLKKEKEARGEEVINFGVGDPDLPPPERVIKKLHEASLDPRSHRYPQYSGTLELRTAIAQWYETRFNVTLDPKNEVLVLCGSKEGIGLLPSAFVNPGDGVLIPTPAYPIYNSGTLLAGGTPLYLQLREENKFLPDFEELDRKALDRAKLLFLNFPANPTGATVDEGFFERVAHFAEKLELIVCHDNAYSEIYFDGKRPPSYLQVKGAKEAGGVEFHSFSKTFSMAGFRLGFVVGNRRVLEGLSKIKSTVDVGVYTAIQEAGVVALEQCWKDCDGYRKVYQERRDLFCSELKRLGFEFQKPEATFYVWVKVPIGFSSETFSEFLLREADVLVLPGSGFGLGGQGFVRFALTVSDDKIKVALKKIKEAMRKR